jgi:uncharacterized protein (DUF302 family)
MQNFKHSEIIKNGTVEEVVNRLNSILPDHTFSVLHVHDVQATLQQKGFKQAPYCIIEFCRAQAAFRVLSENPDIGLFLPCKFLVYQEKQDVRVTTFLPTALMSFFPDTKLEDLQEDVERDILEVMNQLL